MNFDISTLTLLTLDYIQGSSIYTKKIISIEFILYI